jgi:short-subunit dehydrogenase
MSDASPEPPAQGPRRRALITGASSGIGEAFAERLARDGWDLTVVARSLDALEALAKDLRESRGVEVEIVDADLTDAAALRRVEARISEEPVFDLVVNNAGFGTTGAFAESDVDEEESEILLNVVALVRLSRAALGGMVARGRGGIINVSSLAGLGPNPFLATYAATKAFVNSFTEALHEELRGTGVRVQVLCPGFTRTRFQERAGVDPGTIPSILWMDAAPVVDASLAALESDELVCVPGAGNKAASLLAGLVPRGAFRRAMGVMGGRYR